MSNASAMQRNAALSNHATNKKGHPNTSLNPDLQLIRNMYTFIPRKVLVESALHFLVE